jgi:CDP-glucose 4,6-dehydratase
VRATLRGEALRVRNPHAVRPWQHVIEPVSGYLTLAERLWKDGGAFASAWNFGPDDRNAQPVELLADKLTSLWGQPARWVADPGPHLHEAHFLKLDASKARAQLGWMPQLGLDSALAWTVEWYKACAAGAHARALCLEQIEKYGRLTIQ